MKTEWSYKVSKLARWTLDERQFNKHTPLPNPMDIAKLASLLVTKIKQLNLEETGESVFRETAILTETRLLLYNRRRPGELLSLRVDAYHNRSTELDEADLVLRGDLTDYEKHLVESQDLVEIRGKRGRGVPLLIPQEVRRTLEYLSNKSYRKKGGIKEDNPFIFANTGGSVIRAGDSLDDVKNRPDANLTSPERIYANNLRKHTATIAQAISLNDTQLKLLCNHLGHTGKVHEQYYRQTSGIIERIEIAKLMLMQEHNLVGKFRNKDLSEVDFADIDNAAETQQERNGQETQHSQNDREDVEENDDLIIDVDILSSVKKVKTVKRVKWTEEEEREIKIFFKQYFGTDCKKKRPSMKDCLHAIKESKKSDGKICLRNWETLKKSEQYA